MKLHIQDVSFPEITRKLSEQGACKLVKCCRINGWMQCMITIDAGLWHLSLSHPRRYPTWNEIKAARYELLPDERTFAILFPPKAQYVNIHPNCFHLYEVPEMHEGPLVIPAPAHLLTNK